MEKNHEKFLEHLKTSDEAIWLVARWLRSKGKCVMIPPYTAAKKASQWKDHVDGGDLYIVDFDKNGKITMKRLEVKKLGVNFTSAYDWPFRNKFIVCAKHSYDSADPKPEGYIIVSNDKNYFAFVPTTTKNDWYVEQRNDSRYIGVIQDFYFCPKNLVMFRKLDL